MCEYTGAPIANRFFIPTGSQKKGKIGCYATLPILLRAQLDKLGPGADFDRLKLAVEEFYEHPDIPVQKALDFEKVPLSRDELSSYLDQLEMGPQWLMAKNGQSIADVTFPGETRDRNLKRRRLDQKSKEALAEEILTAKITH